MEIELYYEDDKVDISNLQEFKFEHSYDPMVAGAGKYWYTMLTYNHIFIHMTFPKNKYIILGLSYKIVYNGNAHYVTCKEVIHDIHTKQKTYVFKEDILI